MCCSEVHLMTFGGFLRHYVKVAVQRAVTLPGTDFSVQQHMIIASQSATQHHGSGNW
jgi:hypothetical protein